MTIRILIVMIVVVNVACAQKNAKEKLTTQGLDSLIAAERIKLKNSAFCSCLNKIYPNYGTLLNDGSASAYFQTSAYSIKAFEVLDSLTTQLIKKYNYPSIDGAKLGILKCLDYYNSRELEQIIGRLDAELDRNRLTK